MEDLTNPLAASFTIEDHSHSLLLIMDPPFSIHTHHSISKNFFCTYGASQTNDTDLSSESK